MKGGGAMFCSYSAGMKNGIPSYILCCTNGPLTVTGANGNGALTVTGDNGWPGNGPLTVTGANGNGSLATTIA